MAGAPIKNLNAEKWDLEKSIKLFDTAISLTKNKKDNKYEFDFIGEIARELETYKEIFTYLTGRFPELKTRHKLIVSNCEANCYYNGKNNNIIPSLAIMNLKSNHGWTDRIEQKHEGNISNEPTKITFTKKV